MAAVTGANVVTINYRLSLSDEAHVAKYTRPFYSYPTPVHDTLAGLDWIVQTIQPEKLFVFGSNIGGSLAVMLSLTESSLIRAVGAHEPICDWTGLDDYCVSEEAGEGGGIASGKNLSRKFEEGSLEDDDKSPQIKKSARQVVRHRRKHAPFDLVPLLNMRKHLFDNKPSKYFDSFASPMLFLRSAGKDVPKFMPEYHTGSEYPIPVLKKSDLESELIDSWETHTQLEEDSVSSENDMVVQREQRPARRRKALSRWPPYGLSSGNSSVEAESFAKATRLQITLPWVRFFARLPCEDVPSSPSSSETSHALREKSAISKPTISKPTSRKLPGSEYSSVLGTQSRDMVTVMRRACFWSEEESQAEERVTLRNVTRNSSASHKQQLTDQNYLETVHESANWFKSLM